MDGEQTGSECGDADKREAGERAAREYVLAIARLDFERACALLSRLGRAIVISTAVEAGYTTDSCAQALAYISKHAPSPGVPSRSQANVEESATDLALELIAESPWRVTVLGINHAVAVLEQVDGAVSIPLVFEDGEWRIGVTNTSSRGEH